MIRDLLHLPITNALQARSRVFSAAVRMAPPPKPITPAARGLKVSHRNWVEVTASIFPLLDLRATSIYGAQSAVPYGVTFGYTQPLFRGLRFDNNRRQIKIAKKNLSLTDAQFVKERSRLLRGAARLLGSRLCAPKFQVQRNACAIRASNWHTTSVWLTRTLAPIDVLRPRRSWPTSSRRSTAPLKKFLAAKIT